jgi:4-amino-4-deoxy-L-arabinose transferase-like glycosyltransferase
MESLRKFLEKPLFFYSVILIFLTVAFCIRVWLLDSVPKSPYWEEVALGYDAFSILKTGADHHGNKLPIVAFESFGDWKPSGYFYILVPFIWLFDLSVFSVRLPSAIAGVGIVALTAYFTYFVQKQLSIKKDLSQSAAIIGVMIAAVSPWLLLFSRGGWEVNVATAFLYLGFLSGLQVFTKKTISPIWLLSCFIFLALSMYTYHATRVIAPLFGLILVVWWYAHGGLQTVQAHFSQKNNQKYLVLLAPILLLVLLTPLAQSLGSNQVNQRLAETSIFSTSEAVILSNTLKESYANAWWTKYLFHRYFLFTSEIFSQAVSHFTLDFLFVSGDTNPRHSVQMVGHMYVFEIVSILVGLYIVLKRNKKLFALLLAMATVIVFPAAISKAAPHALRTLPLAPLLIALAAVGWIAVYQKIRLFSVHATVMICIAIFGLYTLFVSQFLHYYFVVYPQVQAHEWQYGYEEAIHILSQYSELNPEGTILLSPEYGRPLMYYWFYTKTDPTAVQEWSKSAQSREKDQSELLSFKNIEVIRPGRDQERLDDIVKKSIDDSVKSNEILIIGSSDYLKTITQELADTQPQIVNSQTELGHSIQDSTIKSPINKEIWKFLLLRI